MVKKMISEKIVKDWGISGLESQLRAEFKNWGYNQEKFIPIIIEHVTPEHIKELWKKNIHNRDEFFTCLDKAYTFLIVLGVL